MAEVKLLLDVHTSDSKYRLIQEEGKMARLERHGDRWGEADSVTLAFAYDLDAARARIAELEAGLRRVHDALATPSMPRQSCGEMVAALIVQRAAEEAGDG